MAKKGKSKSRPRRSTGMNIKTALFAYANLAVATRAVTNVSPIQFFTEGYIGDLSLAHTGTAHRDKITMKELLSGGHLGPTFSGDMEYTGVGLQTGSGITSLGETVKRNLTSNAVPAIGALIGLKVADVLITKLGVAKNFNKVVKSIGMKGTIRM